MINKILWRIQRRKEIRVLSSYIYKHQEFLDLITGYDNNSEGNITLDIIDKVAFINISNPRKKNSISGKMMIQFADIVDELCFQGALTSIPCLVMKGKGDSDTFSAGASLDLARDRINSPQRGVLMANFMTDSLNSLRQSAFVSLCFINGGALGGGAELTTFSDFRIMTSSPKSRIQFVHALLGASPGWGGARLDVHKCVHTYIHNIHAANLSNYPTLIETVP